MTGNQNQIKFQYHNMCGSSVLYSNNVINCLAGACPSPSPGVISNKIKFYNKAYLVIKLAGQAFSELEGHNF